MRELVSAYSSIKKESNNQVNVELFDSIPIRLAHRKMRKREREEIKKTCSLLFLEGIITRIGF